MNGVKPTGNFLYRINDAVNVDHVWTMSSSTLLNMRGGWSRFQEPSIRQHQGIFDPASLGFSSGTTQYFGDNQYFPRIEMDDDTFADLGDTFAGGTNFSIYSFQPTVTRIMGNHTMRAGYDFRIYKQDTTPSVHSAGQYTFARATVLTRQLDNSSSAVTGQDLAALLLGLPEQRPHRSQPRLVQHVDVSRRLRPGRLEGHRQADAEPRAALRVRGRADRA